MLNPLKILVPILVLMCGCAIAQDINSETATVIRTHFDKFPRVQILTIEDLLGGKTLQMPPSLE